MALLIGVLALVLFLVFGRTLVKTPPAVLARLARSLAGGLMVGAAAWMTLTGRWEAGIPIGAIGLGLMGYGDGLDRILARFGFSRATSAAPERLATGVIEILIDRRAGRVQGRLLQGPRAGADLDGLSLQDLRAVHSGLSGDPQSRALLETYLDGRAPRWRENVDGDAGRRQRSAPGAGSMSEQEAYQTLGLRPGAGEAEIRAAHRALMKRVHPDVGGTAGLAARLNLAKERLLGDG